MKLNSGELIKQMRKDMDISQEDMADRLYISPRQLSRIETGEKSLDIWQFTSLMELLGLPTEDFWLLYLEANEYREYLLYKQIKRLLKERKFLEAKDVLLELENNSLSERPFINQFIAYAKVATDKDMPHEQAIEGLYAAILISRKDFDESKVSEYRLNYNEISILNHLALRLNNSGEKERAITITKAIIESRDSIRASEEDKATHLPSLTFNLSNYLGQAGRYKESLDYCDKAIKVSREYGNLGTVPRILHNMASCYRLLGEEQQVYKTYLVRAYHCAYAIGDNEVANNIKKDAEAKFGITDL